MKSLTIAIASIVYLNVFCCAHVNNSTNHVIPGTKADASGPDPTGVIGSSLPNDTLLPNIGPGLNKNSTHDLCHNDLGNLLVHGEEYPMIDNNTHKVFPIPSHTVFLINITNIPSDVGFLIAQAHSQTRYIILSHDSDPDEDSYVNGTNPGIYVNLEESHSKHKVIYLTNCHQKNLTVLFIVRNYSSSEPIPGAFPSAIPKKPAMPQPYIVVEPNVLTTEVTFRAAAFRHHNMSTEDANLHYETFLTYMYEKDLAQDSYWNILVATSTIEGLRGLGKVVSTTKNNSTSAILRRWFVSYSGVGEVISVIVNYNNSNGVLYSSTVSYGCNFIDAEEYRCTKLVNPLAKLFCAALLFVGGILLFYGHRWLNFTMFMSGFLFFWLILFLLFAQLKNTSIAGLGWGTLVGAVFGGIGWLMLWHKFQRPFHSALLIITMNVIFFGMVITYFLRYAISPQTNMAAFVVFPVCFAIVIIAYSIADIKKVHIFSCTLLGSYAFVVPFAFYFGSSLTYIVINVIGIITVQHYSDALGYPPFQVCDIILLCLWIILFASGMAYQLYRDRSGPPFYPPNRASWMAAKRAMNFILDKIFSCLPIDPDPGGIGIEDHPTWRLRLSYSLGLLWKRVNCWKQDHSVSGYESLRQARNLSQDVAGSEPEAPPESRLNNIRQRISGWVENVRGHLRKEDRELLQAQDIPETTVDEDMLQDHQVSCCTFGKAQVVLDDAYDSHAQGEAQEGGSQ